jgi:broad specificity phosphatase PhoE
MIRLLLVRHGQTEGNVEERYQGRTDTQLNEVGLQQADRLARRLSSEKIDCIYCSDLKRAMQTAERVASAHNLTVNPRKELRELDVGEFEGKRLEEIVEDHGPLEDMWSEGEWRAPGGETLGELSARVDRFVADVKQHHKDGTILAVAHGGTLRSLISGFLGIDPHNWWRFQLDSASLSVLELHPDRVVLTLLNDTCYLRD